MRIFLVVLVCAFTLGIIFATSYGLSFVIPDIGSRTILMFLIGVALGAPAGMLIDRIWNG